MCGEAMGNCIPVRKIRIKYTEVEDGDNECHHQVEARLDNGPSRRVRCQELRGAMGRMETGKVFGLSEV